MVLDKFSKVLANEHWGRNAEFNRFKGVDCQTLGLVVALEQRGKRGNIAR